MEQLLVIKQNKMQFKDELHVQDIRNIGHLLNGIEMLHKLRLFHSEKSIEFIELDLPAKQRLYKKTYRIKVLSINKNSPIELVLVMRSLNETIELVNLFFNDQQQEEALKFTIGQICSIDFDLTTHQTHWKQIYNAYKACKRIISGLNLYHEIQAS